MFPIAPGDTSMTPHLAGGDVVVAVPPRPVPRPGDLLIYLQQDYLVVHRYLGAARDPSGRPCLRTRGDGRNQLDPPLFAEAVRARVVSIGRSGAWRTVQGPMPEAYARLVAWHDQVWAVLGIAGRKVGLGRAVAAIDGALLRLVARLFFAPVHGRMAPPDRPRPEASV
jgi:hypothetical protein